MATDLNPDGTLKNHVCVELKNVVTEQIFYYQIICGGFGLLIISLFVLWCYIICHYRAKFKQIRSTVGIKTLLKRADKRGGTIETLGIHTLNADEVDEATGILNLNNRSHLCIMLSHFTRLLKDKVEIEMKQSN